MIKTQYIRLDMTPGGTHQVLFCSQYDVGRPLGMVVYNGGEAVDLSTYTCTIEATRTDGTAITAAVTTDGNVGTFATTTTMTNVADKYPAKMVIVDGSGNRVASLAFVMMVTPATMDENAESIEEDKTLYQQYTGTVQGLIATERKQRINADNTLQSNINTEVSARESAISAEATARQTADNALQSAINTESSTRATADANLQTQIDQLVAPSGEAPSAAEVENARIGTDGTVYATVGDALRAQIKAVNDQIATLNSANLVSTMTKDSKTAHGITWEWSGDSVTVTGSTPSEASLDTLFYSGNSLPAGMVAGGTYTVIYAAQKVRLSIWDFSGGTVGTLLLDRMTGGTFTIPATCTGLIIRLRVLQGETNVNETVSPVIYGVRTNAELDEMRELYYSGQKAGIRAISDCMLRTKNLINPDTLTDGYILNNNVPTAIANYFYSDYIKTGCVLLYYRDQGASIGYLVSCYDENYTYLGAVDYSSTEGYQRVIVSDGSHPTSYYIIQPKPGTVYVRVNGRYKTNLMLTPFFYPPISVAYGETYTYGNADGTPLKVGMFGDSIIYGTNGNTSQRVSKPITDYVEEITGFDVTNLGEGSMGWVSTAYNPRIAYDKISETDLTQFDVITLCYGVNDSSATMGTYDSTDETTIMGQVNKCIKYIGAQNPGARIILIAPWNGASYGTFPDWRYTVRTSGGFTRAELSDTLKQAAEFYYVGFISQKDSPLNGFGIGTVDGQKTGPYLGTDHVHPTPEGYKAMGEWLSAKIAEIVL